MKNTMNFSFSFRQEFNQDNATEDFTSEDEDLHHSFNISDEAKWTEVMDKFVKFLGAVYGYDISKNVKYDLPRISNFDYNKL